MVPLRWSALSLRDAVGGGLLLLLAEAVSHHRAGELFLGDVFATLPEGSYAFKPETERGSRSWSCSRPFRGRFQRRGRLY